jgi:hypothetical protein
MHDCDIRWLYRTIAARLWGAGCPFVSHTCLQKNGKFLDQLSYCRFEKKTARQRQFVSSPGNTGMTVLATRFICWPSLAFCLKSKSKRETLLNTRNFETTRLLDVELCPSVQSYRRFEGFCCLIFRVKQTVREWMWRHSENSGTIYPKTKRNFP